MSSYVVNTKQQQQEMLKELGYDSFNALFVSTGIKNQLDTELALPQGASELEVYQELKALSMTNKVYPLIFRGAGAYRHYIPSVVRHITSREEFVSAYTPYQAEISQGILQAIFEYQTMICELTGMDVSNASVYDGASATAEAINMCVDKDHDQVLLSDSLNPEVLATVKTYYQFADLAFSLIANQDGVIDHDSLKRLVSDKTACIVLGYPNYYGCIEDIQTIKTLYPAIKLIVVTYPISLGLLESPGALGADIVVGEGQPLGMPLSFGGPYLGFMATKDSLVRRLPGRIVGQTVDLNGQRAFTLTLQAREQHIRREKASSSICTNQALCALTSAVYLSALGPNGLAEVADACFQNAHYLAEKLTEIGFKLVYKTSFFNEFVTYSPFNTKQLDKALAKKDILGGYPLDDYRILWCATELTDKAAIDHLIATIKEVN